jgi:ABC-2 type transport system permease protein
VVRPYVELLKAQVRGQASYRVSFAIDLAGNILALTLDLVTIVALFQVTPALGGFSIGEVVLMFGLSQCAFAIADLAVGNIEKLRFYVRSGLLDAVLVRPLGVLRQLLVLDFGTRRVGRVLYALVLFLVAARYVDIRWTPARLLMMVVAPLAGAVLFAAIFVGAATVAFWWIESGELANSVTYGGREFTSYPSNIYSGWFRRVFAFGAGFAFVGYYPALFLLGRADPLGLPAATAWLSPLFSAAVAGAAAVMWRTGVRHYRSTGS